MEDHDQPRSGRDEKPECLSMKVSSQSQHETGATCLQSHKSLFIVRSLLSQRISVCILHVTAADLTSEIFETRHGGSLKYILDLRMAHVHISGLRSSFCQADHS